MHLGPAGWTGETAFSSHPHCKLLTSHFTRAPNQNLPEFRIQLSGNTTITFAPVPSTPSRLPLRQEGILVDYSGGILDLGLPKLSNFKDEMTPLSSGNAHDCPSLWTEQEPNASSNMTRPTHSP
jgi:hypothetical protein